MKLVYIAGPFTGKTTWDVECNVRRVEAMALAVAKAGAMPVCPHTNTRFFHGQCTHQFWYDGTMELLRRCADAIFLVPGWEESKGSVDEYEESFRLGIPAFDNLDDLKYWIGGQ